MTRYSHIEYSPKAIVRDVYEDSDVTCIAFSHDGRMLAAGNNNGTITIWNCVCGEIRFSYKGHSPVLSLAWSLQRNSPRLYSGFSDGILVELVPDDEHQVGHFAYIHMTRCVRSLNFRYFIPMESKHLWMGYQKLLYIIPGLCWPSEQQKSGYGNCVIVMMTTLLVTLVVGSKPPNQDASGFSHLQH